MFNYEDFEVIQTIKDFNKFINDVNCTHFHHICYYNYSDLEVIQYCFENGADLNFQNIYKNIPFHFICMDKTEEEVLEYCLENGADLTIKNDDGKTPFYYICLYNKDLSHYMESGYTG